ncbi:hypothetical protein DXT63_12565 [Thermoanaerobacteraceae bacterium SP2]|nr:hypothetical protein DXT63_12565 [Thermoanaerobacteraceae bacterium SP2]
MGKKIITGTDVELALSLGNKKIDIDENTIITGIAQEMADKARIEFLRKTDNRTGDQILGDSSKYNFQDIPQKNDDVKNVKEQDAFVKKLEKIDIHEKQIEEILHRIYLLDERFKNYSNVAFDKSITRDAIVEELDIKIEKGLCVIPDQGIIECDLGIKEGKIWSMGREIRIPAKKNINAAGKCILPGIIDPHIHLGIFADFATEVETETRAALKGGVTTAGCFFGGTESHFKTFPPLEKILREKSKIDIIPHFVISNHTQLSEVPEYIKRFGVRTFKIYMSGIPGMIPDVDDAFILDVFEVLKEVKEDCTVFIHAENPVLIKRATEKYRGKIGNPLQIWSQTHPAISEEEAVRRAAFYAEKTGVKIYFVHISTREAVNALRELKAYKGLKNIYAETTSPYLTLTTDSPAGIKGKMVPPLRERESVEALWDGINQNLIDTIGTDNTTITLEEKRAAQDIWSAVPGYPVLGTHLASILHEGVNGGRISLEKLVEVMCKNPAKILGLYPKKGTIVPGGDADLVIVDLDEKRTVKPEILGSRSDFSLFDGRELRGWPVMTIKSGHLA